MKRIICIMFVVLFAVMLCACQKHENSKVLAIQGGFLGSTDTQTFEITERATTSIEKTKLGSHKNIEFAGKQYELIYCQTINYVVGGTEVDQYTVIGGKKGDSILLLPNDTIYAMLCSSIKSIDVDKHASTDSVKAAVESALSDEISFSNFEHCTVNESLEDKTEGFGLYTFTWYNTKGNIMTDDFVKVCVRQDGDVGALWLKSAEDLPVDLVPDDISIDLYVDDIEKKLQDLYSNQIVDYEVISSTISCFGSDPCIDCIVSVHSKDSNGEVVSDACELVLIIR